MNLKELKSLIKECISDIRESSSNVNEGVDDPIIFKAIFTAGGPGSGKSYAIQKMGLKGMGYSIVDSDKVYETLLKKKNLSPTPDVISSPEGQQIRGRAKELSGKLKHNWINGRLGIVIDGTGKNFEKINEINNELKKLGYESSMIFVNTSLETALKRNKMRNRSLPDKFVKQMWSQVQNNIGKFQRLFGNNFIILDNNEGNDLDLYTNKAYGKVKTWSETIPTNKNAKNWIISQGGRI